MIGKIYLALLLAMASGLASAGSREDIHPTAEDAQPLMPGMQAPAFEVRDVHGEPFRFDPDAMQSPVVLTFYRGGWCPYCNLHLSELRHAESELREIGFDIWFISIDRPEVLRDSLDEPDLGYTLFSDSKLEATRAFGIAFRLDDETFRRYLGYGHDMEKISGETHHVLPVPSTFIIGADGVISFAYSNPDYTVRLHPNVLLAAAIAHQKRVDGRLRQLREEQREAGNR